METNLIKNIFYNDCCRGEVRIYDDMILHLLIEMDKSSPGFLTKLHTVKYLKDNCKSSIIETKDFLDILFYLDLIDSNYNAKKSLYYLNALDISNILKNNIDVSLYLRVKKIKKVNTKLTI